MWAAIEVQRGKRKPMAAGHHVSLPPCSKAYAG
jgi:hypothetical protein